MFASAEFWVAVAFFIFWGVMFYYGVPGKLLGSLDRRGKRIADELAEAKRLRQEAEALLKEFEQKRGAAEREAAEIVSLAREEAERLAAEAQQKIAEFVKRRTAIGRGEDRPGRNAGHLRSARRRRRRRHQGLGARVCATS